MPERGFMGKPGTQLNDAKSSPKSTVPLPGSARVLIPLYATYAIFVLCIFLVFIPQLRNQLIDQKKQAILQLTENTISLLTEFDNRITQGELTPEQGREDAIDQIRHMRYGPEGKDYFWIIDMHPFMIMHPYRPDLEGTDLTQFRDTDGYYPFIAMIETVNRTNGGYVNYSWQWKDVPGRQASKVSYVKQFPPWGWVVGTGIYVDDIYQEISTITLNFIQILGGILVFIILLSVYITRQVFLIERKNNLTEAARALEELRLKKLLELTELSGESMERLTEFALEEAINLTKSDIGYLAFLNEDESQLSMHTWSKKVMKQCDIKEKQLTYEVLHAGLWAEAARSGQTVIINDYESCDHPHKKGFPEGHVRISRVLNVPVVDGGRIIALAGVGNKKDPYDDSDVRQLKLLMDGMTKILQRKKADDALRESEERYRLLADNATDTIWVMELSTFTLSYVSPSGSHLLGYEPEQLKELTLDSFLNQNSIEKFHAIISEGLAQDALTGSGINQLNRFETELIRQDGSVIWVEVATSFLRTHTGTPDRILGITREITQRKELEQKLRDSNTDLCQAERIAHIGHWSLDPYIGIPEWSDEVYRIYERDPGLGPFSRDEYRTVYTGQWLDLLTHALGEAVSKGLPFDIECQLSLPSDRIKWVNVIGEPQLTEHRNCFFIRGTIQEITDRKKMEMRIQQTQKMEALGTLAGGIAHDFNNILASIIGFTELSRIGASGNKPVMENLELVLAAGLRARDLVKHIMTFSRKADVQKTATPIVPLIKETLKFLRASIPPGIEIQTQFVEPDSTVLADPTQMHQVFMNLFTNAVHAMKDNGGVLTVTLDSFQLLPDDRFQEEGLSQGNYVRIIISDTGRGIPRDVIDRIFEPFFTTKNRGEGTGMGLSVSYGIIKDMQGYISVYSEENEGTTFQVLLPELQEYRTSSQALGPAVITKGNGNLLLVDDEVPIVNWMSQVLSSAGYKVTSMTSSSEAYKAFCINPMGIDLVLTDLTMPGITGLELTELIKKERPDLPVVLCTGFSGEVTQDLIERYGISGVLMKPMIASELSRAVASALEAVTKGGL